jgi:predicted ATPase
MSSGARGPAPILVGREAELDQLRGWFAEALEGRRRIVFVTGEPGIGKTTFVRAFLDSIAQERAVRIGCGQCIEQYGAGEGSISNHRAEFLVQAGETLFQPANVFVDAAV